MNVPKTPNDFLQDIMFLRVGNVIALVNVLLIDFALDDFIVLNCYLIERVTAHSRQLIPFAIKSIFLCIAERLLLEAEIFLLEPEN